MLDEVLRNVASLIIVSAVALVIAASRPRHFAATWLGIAVGLIVLHALLVTRFYGLVPSPLSGIEHWNWSGKLLAIAGMLTLIQLSGFGWKETGLTFGSYTTSGRTAWIVGTIVCIYYLLDAVRSPQPIGDVETLAFQWGLPGIEEEMFYRGILLFVFDRAFTGKAIVLGAKIGWGGVFVTLLFALDHAIVFHLGSPTFKPTTFIGTGLPGLMFLWLRERSGSVILPAVVHNFGNAAPISF